MADQLKERFRKLLVLHRKRCGMTQPALEEKSKVGKEMISRIERGVSEPSFETIEKLANALGIDFAELFTTEIPRSSLRSPEIAEITVRVAGLNKKDLPVLHSFLDTLAGREK
ncbi:MAG: helix-turn-helix transcriptional regulator [Asticcacaulis sp.]|uniref:helix-turn-helix domain-containing protein n=1 Tax=Asticcacaulis sp. TaxID=1872648 RepID=UPI0039E5C819